MTRIMNSICLALWCFNLLVVIMKASTGEYMHPGLCILPIIVCILHHLVQLLKED